MLAYEREEPRLGNCRDLGGVFHIEEKKAVRSPLSSVK